MNVQLQQNGDALGELIVMALDSKKRKMRWALPGTGSKRRIAPESHIAQRNGIIDR